MAIPTTYTYATFRSYLENEILQKVAVSLGWKNKLSYPATTYTMAGYWDDPNKVFYLSEKSPATFYAGSFFTQTFLEPGQNQLRITALKGSLALNFRPPPPVFQGEIFFGTDTYQSRTMSYTYPAEAGYDAQSIYDSITNEVLVLMGYSTPELVPASEVAKFRMMGRAEAWRAVVYATTGDSDIVISDNLLNRSQINDFSLNQLEYAQGDYDTSYPYIRPSIGKPRAMSYAGQLTVRF